MDGVFVMAFSQSLPKRGMMSGVRAWERFTHDDG